MIDHLLRFSDELSAQNDILIGLYYILGDNKIGNWRGDICIPNASAYQITGTQIIVDDISGNKYSQDIRVSYPGWFLIISLPSLSKEFINIPNNSLRLAANRDTGQVIYLASDLDPSILSTSKIEPLFAGSVYSI